MSTNIIDGKLPSHVVPGAIDSCSYSYKYNSLPSDDDLTSSNSETEHDDLVSDEHGVREYG